MKTELTDKNTFNLLKFLLEGEVSKEDVLQILNIKTSTFYRHLNLIKKAGFDIKQESLKYELLNYKKNIQFANYELSIFAYLLLIAYIMLPDVKFCRFKNAVDRMLCLTSKEDANLVKEKFEAFRLTSINKCYGEKITTFQKHMEAKKYIKVITKKAEEIEMLPLEFNWDKNKIYLVYLDIENNQNKILLNNVVKILENKNEIKISKTKETIFELYGKLAKSYLLKEDERIIDFTKDKIVVANYSKDKERLFKRLLRYETFCKVTFPKTDVEKFKNLVEKSLDNLCEFLDNI